MQKRLELGVENGELPPDADCAGLARYYVTVIQGLAVGAVSGLNRTDLLATAATAMKVWPRQPYSDITKFLLRFPRLKITGVQGYVDFTKKLDELGMPPLALEEVRVEPPQRRSMTFREFDSDAMLRDSAVWMTGRFNVVPSGRFDFGRALRFFKSLSSSHDPLEDFRQFWTLVAPQSEAILEKVISDVGGEDEFAARLRKLSQEEPDASH